MGKNIVLTGVSKRNGIGFQVALELSKRGHKIWILLRDPIKSQPLLSDCGKNCIAVEANLEEEISIVKAAEAIRKDCKVVDVLINNAGTLLDGSTALKDVTSKQLLSTFKVNTIAPLRLFQELLALLEKSRSPRVINVSSGAGQLADGEIQNWAPAYSASKAALNALTQQMAGSYPKMAINSVCPGWCNTEMGGSAAPRTPAQGADTIVWLADEAEQSLTGKFLRDRVEISW